MHLENVKKIVENIDGWLSNAEGELIYDFAKNCTGKGVIVEIGSWKGKSTIWLGKGSEAGNKTRVYAVDPHTGSSEHQRKNETTETLEEFTRNIKNAKVDNVVVPLIKTSEEAARNFDRLVEFIFIDGAHEYEFVKLDLDAWFPKVINGGVMAFHDTIYWDGPKKVVNDSIYKSKFFKNVGFIDSITFATKVKHNSVYDRIRNRYILFLKHICELACRWRLPKLIKTRGQKVAKILQRT